MPRKARLLFLANATGLSGCRANDTERGLAAAAGGAVIALATDGRRLVTGAGVGGAAGCFCRDLNVPGCRN